MIGLQERHPNHVSRNVRLMFWSHFSSGQYEDVLEDFIETHHQVRTDSLTARRMLPRTITLKASKGTTEWQDASTRPTRTLVAWQRRVIP